MNKKLIYGESYSNSDLMNIFHCKNSGGIRYSKGIDVLLLITNSAQEVYDDRMKDGEILYVGEGLRGDQDIVKGNKILYKSYYQHSGTTMLFFEKCNDLYTFLGEVCVSRNPYQEMQKDIDGNLRKVWIFPLKIIN